MPDEGVTNGGVCRAHISWEPYDFMCLISTFRPLVFSSTGTQALMKNHVCRSTAAESYKRDGVWHVPDKPSPPKGGLSFLHDIPASQVINSFRSQLVIMQESTGLHDTDLGPVDPGVIGQEALSSIPGFARGRRMPEKPVVLSVASAGAVLMASAALGVYLMNVHPYPGSWV